MNVKFRGSMFIFLMLCVNDILLASGNEKMSLETKTFSPLNFDMKDLGEAIYVLRIKAIYVLKLKFTEIDPVKSWGYHESIY